MQDIMIVEDSENDRFFLQRILQEVFDGDLVFCSTGDEALARFDPDRFIAVILDLNLPGMDGIELILRIRLMSAETFIPVLTGSEDPVRRTAAIAAGATSFHLKPMTVEELKMLMAQIAAKKIAYERGKRLKDWRMTLAGGCAAAGSALLGSIIILHQTTTLSGLSVTLAALAGLVMQVIGILASGWFGVDRKSLEDRFRKLMRKGNDK